MIVSIINEKGGVAKTTTCINMADILTRKYKKKVLLIDNDKQGNISKFFGWIGYDFPTIADLLTDPQIDAAHVIQKTQYAGLDLIPANRALLRANKDVLMDKSRPQQIILRDALEPIKKHYDFILIDNAPDINISTINALVMSDDVIIPVKIDKFAFDGFDAILDSIEDALLFNPNLKLAGCLLTMVQTNTRVDSQGIEYLRQYGYPTFEAMIRRTKKVDEMTFYGQPLLEYAPYCTACFDYQNFVKEYLENRNG